MVLTAQELNNLPEGTAKTEATIYLQRLVSVLQQYGIPEDMINKQLYDENIQFDTSLPADRDAALLFKHRAGMPLTIDEQLYGYRVGSALGAYAKGFESKTFAELKNAGLLPQDFPENCTLKSTAYMPKSPNLVPLEETTAFDYLRRSETSEILTFTAEDGRTATLYMKTFNETHWNNAQDNKIHCSLYTEDQYKELSQQARDKAAKIGRKTQLRDNFINDMCARAATIAPGNSAYQSMVQTEKFKKLMGLMIKDMSKEHKVRSSHNIMSMLEAISQIPPQKFENPKCLITVFGSTSNQGVEKAAATLFGKDWQEQFAFIPATSYGDNYLVTFAGDYIKAALLDGHDKQLAAIAKDFWLADNDKAIDALAKLAKERDAITKQQKPHKNNKTHTQQNQYAHEAQESHDKIETRMQLHAAKFAAATFELEHDKRMSLQDVGTYHKQITKNWDATIGRAREIAKYQTPEYVQELIASAVDLPLVESTIAKHFSNPERIEQEKEALVETLTNQYNKTFEKAINRQQRTISDEH